MLFVGRFSKRPGRGEFASGLRNIGAFALQIILDRAAQAWVGDKMRRICGLWKIAARELVLALRTGFYRLQAARDGKIDRLIIAHLEMQKRVMLDRAPVAAAQGVGADEIDGTGDPP